MNKRQVKLRHTKSIAGAIVIIGVAVVLLMRRDGRYEPIAPVAPEIIPESTTSVAVVEKIIADRKRLDETVWSDEVAAQKYEEIFVRLWDNLRASKHKSNILASFPFRELHLRKPSAPRQHELDVQEMSLDAGKLVFTPAEWRDWLDKMKSEGFELIQSEWHHSEFDPDELNRRSVVAMTLFVNNESKNTLYIVKGDLQVDWESNGTIPRTIEAKNLKVLSRRGSSVFEDVTNVQIETPSERLVMLMAFDLNDDGLSELVLPSSNAVYWNRGNWEFQRDTLFDHPPNEAILTGVLADFTGDGRADLLGASFAGIHLFAADQEGRFSQPASNLFAQPTRLMDPMVITAGDIDADGDLDVWLGQYKSAYQLGQMPTPYYDANDGFPAYLFRNRGDGQFTEVTEQAGLAEKRHRRTYSASFVDLDADNDLDLTVASDFAGLDIYTNDGSGKFTEATESLVDLRHSFGMALTFGDYDGNSALDFMMIGMSSTTARRLERLGLGRTDFPQHQEFRDEMGYGNRLYVASDGKFKQAPFNDQVARTGWSWGVSSFDFDNDGDQDIYAANGHISGETAKDYCTKFWCHDIYTGNSKESAVFDNLFTLTMDKELRSGSWNGFEHNALLSNQQEQGFLSIGFLMGVALENDSRNVLTDDLNGDGYVDLVVAANGRSGSPDTVRVFRNTLQTDSNWIGLRLTNAPCSGVGARVEVKTASRSFTSAVVNGDSLRSQHAPVIHFGLGVIDEVDEIVVQWPHGKTLRLPNPEINQYHVLR